MTFLAPFALWFLAALPVIFILYLIQSRYRPQVVASLLLWKRMARDLEAEASWRRPRWDWLLVLQLLAALFAALALARPAILGGGSQRVAIVLDASASMAARDVQPNRFAVARQQAADVVNGAAADARVSLIAAGAQPRVVVENGSPSNVLAALDGLQAESGATDLSSAIRVAAGLAAPAAANGSQVVVVTDGATELDVPQQSVPVTFKVVASSGQNVAISEVSLRRPIERADYLAGFARIVNFGSEPRITSMVVFADALPVDRSPVGVPGVGHADATFHVPTTAQTISVVLADRDVLAAGDRVDVASYARWARGATIVSDTPSAWERVLSVVPDLATRSIRPADFAPGDYGPNDIVLFDNVVPTQLPKSPLVLVNPPETSSLLVRSDTLARQRHVAQFDTDDPLLRGLDIAPLSVQQIQRAVTPNWAASSADADDTPLILHGVLNDQRTVMFAFDPAKSNLPHLAAYPLLMANVVDWLVPGREAVLHGGLGSETNIQPHQISDVPASTTAATLPSTTELWPWFVAAAVVFFALEWGVAVRRG
jgi:hypothetical protein